MSTKVDFRLLGTERLRRKLKPEMFRGPAERFIKRGTEEIEGQIKRETPVDTGRLRSSITRNLTDPLTGRVGTNVKYARYVEFGSRPHWPPLSAMQPWARRHGFPAGRQGAFLVARAIAKRGTKARKMFQKGMQNSRGAIAAEMRMMLRDIEMKWRAR